MKLNQEKTGWYSSVLAYPSSVLACPWAGLVCLARLQALPFLWRCKKRPNIPPSPLFTGVSACGVHFETPHKPHKTPHFWWSASSQNWLHQQCGVMGNLCGVSKWTPHSANPLYIGIPSNLCGMWSYFDFALYTVGHELLFEFLYYQLDGLLFDV